MEVPVPRPNNTIVAPMKTSEKWKMNRPDVGVLMNQIWVVKDGLYIKREKIGNPAYIYNTTSQQVLAQ